MTMEMNPKENYLSEIDDILSFGYGKDILDILDYLEGKDVEEEVAPPSIAPPGKVLDPDTNTYKYKVRCKFCGKEYLSIHSTSNTCKSPECKREYQRQWRQKNKDSLAMQNKRIKNRAYMQEYRSKGKSLGRKIAKAKRLAEQDRLFREKGVNYGKWRAGELLKTIPKIDVNL